MTTTIMSFSSFVIDHEWSRNTVRLAQASSGWLREMAGQDVLSIFNKAVNLALLEDWLGGVDRFIYIPTAIADLGSVEKTYQLFGEGHETYRMLSLFYGATKFLADSFAAIDCLKAIGIVIVIPYIGHYGLACNAFGIAAGVFKLSQSVYDLGLITFRPKIYKAIKRVENPEKKIDLINERNKVLVGMVAGICGLSISVFSTCKLLYDPILAPKDRMGEVPFRFWNTIGTMARMTENYFDQS